MFKPIYTVCYDGLESSFCSLVDAARFGATLIDMRTSFDVWRDDVLLSSHTYNFYTGDYETAVYG